jgi:tight adherence protein B
MRLRRPALVALAALGAMLGVPMAAGAAPGDAVELTPAGGTRFPAQRFVLTLPQQRQLGEGDVRVTENGEDVTNLKVTPGDAAGVRSFGVMLVIDTSLSMRGAPILAAMRAARAFAAQRPANQRLGVMFFNGTATVALPPTTDGADIDAVLRRPVRLGRGTHIYDAAAVGVRVLARSGISAPSLVLLSDGADGGSRRDEGDVARAAHAAKARVFTVGLRSPSYRRSTLQGLATATRGRYAEATRRQLSALFAALGQRLSREYLVSYTSLASLGRHVGVAVDVRGLPGVATASYVAPRLGNPSVPATAPTGEGDPGARLPVAAIVVALLLGLAVFRIVRPRRPTVRARIEAFTGGGMAEVVDPAVQALEELHAAERPRRSSSQRWLRFAEDIDVAGWAVAPERVVGLVLLATLVLVIGAFAARNPALVVLALTVPLIGRMVVAARASAQRREFEAQLADNLQVVASAMRAGQSFVGALAVAVQDAAEPARSELQRAVTDERLGVPLDVALARAAARMRSDELEYVGLVANLQRETGGSTADVLNRVTETIRERAELRRLVRTLSAQGRLGGGIVTALPLGIAAFFAATKPGYFDPLVNGAGGRILIGLAALMLLAGWASIRKIVNIEV